MDAEEAEMEAVATVAGPLRRSGDDDAILGAELHCSSMVLEPRQPPSGTCQTLYDH